MISKKNIEITTMQLTGVNVDLLNQIAVDTYGNSDQISGIDNVYGTSYDDLLKGNENGNTLLGYSGNDILKGYGGNDVIVGGSGADIIDGGAGNDLLTGDDGYYQNADLFIFKGVLKIYQILVMILLLILKLE